MPVKINTAVPVARMSQTQLDYTVFCILEGEPEDPEHWLQERENAKHGLYNHRYVGCWSRIGDEILGAYPIAIVPEGVCRWKVSLNSVYHTGGGLPMLIILTFITAYRGTVVMLPCVIADRPY
jgi:hypothetical protein